MGQEHSLAVVFCAKSCCAMQGLLPDGLHPNAAGMELIAECLELAFDSLLGPSQNGTAPRTFTTRQYNSHTEQLPC